jgi:large subunit ribosomal protein L11e
LGLKYDPTVGIYGMDFYVVMGRKGGMTVGKRKRKTSHIGAPHRITKEETMRWFQQKVWTGCPAAARY